MLTVLLLSGFVVAVLAILGFTPALERWATAVVAPAVPEVVPEDSSFGG